MTMLSSLMMSMMVTASLPLPPTLIVAPLSSRKTDSADSNTLTSLIRIYAGQSSQFTLVTPEELGAIDEELKRQLSGGCDETSCIADIGGALGAKYMLTGGLNRLGNRYILTLKLIDIEKVRAVSTVADQSNSIEAFADSLPAKIRELFKEGGRAPNARELQAQTAQAEQATKAARQEAERARQEADEAKRQLALARQAADSQRIQAAQQREAEARSLELAKEKQRRRAARREAEARALEEAQRKAAKKAKLLGSLEFPAKHCKAIKRARPKAKDGMYYLKRSKAPYPSWCDMQTKGGGWTLVLSIDGRKNTFAYDSPLWTNKKTLNAKLAKKPPFEVKTKAFYRVPFKEVRILMWDGKKYWAEQFIPYKARSLYDVFKDGKYKPTKLGRKRWKSLVKGGSLQRRCNKEGFNVYNRLMRVRIGIIANQENDCSTPDSRIGIGAGSSDPLRGPNRSVGNEAIGFEPDNGVKRTTAWGLVYVR